MKKIALIICIIMCFLLCSACAKKDPGAALDTDGSSTVDHQSTIAALEAEIIELKKNQQLADSERQQKIDELTAIIESLKAQDGKTENDDTSQNVSPSFKYTISGTTATVTGYTGNDDVLVIPASIDGYRVTAIGDGAFEGSKVKTVIISDGVENVGWFAFNGCTSLCSVTVPSSVKSIGHLAFGEGQERLTIYCHSGSFALAYAKSYGLTYTVI